jgi:protein gp37
MSDLFHDQVPDGYIARVFAVMALARRHTFQVLTKRHGRMRSLLGSVVFDSMVRAEVTRLLAGIAAFPASWDREGHVLGWPLPNVWLGVSAEDQRWADIRIPALLDTPAAVRFVSTEPLLGPVDLRRWISAAHPGFGIGAAEQAGDTGGGGCPDGSWSGIDWVIVGGESGHGARPLDLRWVRSLRDQCQNGGAAFFFKQTGSVLARQWGCSGKGGDPTQWPEPFPRQYPTKEAG